MPTIADFGFCGQSYPAASTRIDAQRSVNLYPETELPTSKMRAALIGTPGLSTLMTLPNAPVRALWAGDGRLFAVGGNHFYEVGPFSGAIVTDYGAMAGDGGGIADSNQPCQIVSNSTQLLVMNGVSQRIYNAAGGVMTAVQMGGADLRAVALEYLDGFYIAIATGASLQTASPNQINISALGDGTSWSALDYVIRTGAPDLLVQLAVVNGQLWLFGQKSIEVWYNAGNPLFPFARIQGATINTGLWAPFSVAKLDNTLFWLGSSDRGTGIVYRANGFQPERISNPAVEYLISTVYANAIGCTGFAYEEGGHSFYVLTFPSAGSDLGGPGATLAYDITTKQWHERGWWNATASKMESSRAYCFASISSNPGQPPAPTTYNFVGDRTTGAIYQMGLQFPSDAGAAIQRIRRAPHVADRNFWYKYPGLEIDADIGTAQIALSYSNDGGKTFPHSRAAISGSNEQGGAFPRFRWWQLGRSLDRVFQATITDDTNPIYIAGAYLNAAPGTQK